MADKPGEEIMAGSVLLEWIAEYGLAAVFIMIAMEYACFPMPSEILLPFAGAFAAQNGIGFFSLLLVSVGAGITGAFTCYLIGAFGGSAVIDRISRKHPKTAAGINASRAWFHRYGNLSVMIGRVLPICRTYISFVAGISRQNPVWFAAFSLIGISIWNLVLTGLGFMLGDNWERVSVYAEKYKYILLPVVLVLIFGIINHIRNKRK
ncbi:MAG TPA: DedA family protein [Clostridia bacterium]|nr:DedA family protein [Clostridia bacterium]